MVLLTQRGCSERSASLSNIESLEQCTSAVRAAHQKQNSPGYGRFVEEEDGRVSQEAACCSWLTSLPYSS